MGPGTSKNQLKIGPLNEHAARTMRKPLWLAIPLHGLGVILGKALSIGVHDADNILGFSFTLLDGLQIPLRRLGIVPGNAQALAVHEAEVA